MYDLEDLACFKVAAPSPILSQYIWKEATGHGEDECGASKQRLLQHCRQLYLNLQVFVRSASKEEKKEGHQ